MFLLTNILHYFLGSQPKLKVSRVLECSMAFFFSVCVCGLHVLPPRPWKPYQIYMEFGISSVNLIFGFNQMFWGVGYG